LRKITFLSPEACLIIGQAFLWAVGLPVVPHLGDWIIALVKSSVLLFPSPLVGEGQVRGKPEKTFGKRYKITEAIPDR
jgi:hypothetical protein